MSEKDENIDKDALKTEVRGIVRESVNKQVDKVSDEKGRNAVNEAEESELVDNVMKALDSINADPNVYDGGENFNVGFKIGDVEYYVRPNDKGNEEYYIDADKDDFESFKVSDTEELKKVVQKMHDKKEEGSKKK